MEKLKNEKKLDETAIAGYKQAWETLINEKETVQTVENYGRNVKKMMGLPE